MFRKIALVAILSLAVNFCFSGNSKAEVKPAVNEKEINTPADLSGCYKELTSIMSQDELDNFKNKGEASAVTQARFSLGSRIMNDWGLRSGSRLAEFFKNNGISRPDDMLSIILISFHRYLNNKDIEFEKQVRDYKNYWAKQKR